ncbi:uncharacterized protein LAJ45_01871 [Morchella importuna]|uniref:uncharacterized protein n=1 Tax=Morchella importuna TaxID=1174673 RepID=UPI001E8E46F5|nr:uncharacterized protein LAJ45_01871 [Morchella importuna]KAH8154104.1 hypothetical protein LAJ45_01871 [Morchella importuna]
MQTLQRSSVGMDLTRLSFPRRDGVKPICRTKGEKTPDPEELDEELLRRTCESLNIDYSLFDDWTEDPRGMRIEDMKIPFLPSEIMLQIFSECRPEVLVECKKTCRRFRDLLSGNSSIWRKARDKSYPGLPLKLPLDFDEEELFDMTTGKKCDYCDTKKKVRPYYVWSVRCCQECIKTLTLSASEFKRMLKRKVGESSDWDAQKRELICHTIKWHDLPTGARLCWKEEAYARINEAEEVLLEERFREWYLESSVSKDMREVFWVLEDWGADVPRMMKKDKENEKNKVIDARKELYKAWCLKILPNPIPSETLPLLSAYNSTVNKPGFLTKKEFVLSLPRLIRDSIRFDDEVRRHKALERQNRLKHDDLLEETVQQVMHALIREGSAKNWGSIVREKVKEASSSKIDLKFPKDTPEAVLREWRWRCNDLGIPLLYRFANLLEEALDRETSPYRDLLHPSVFEFFENEEDRIFTCHGLSMQFTHIGPTFHRQSLVGCFW